MAIFLLSYVLATLANAADFAACTQMLLTDASLRPFTAGPRGTLTEDELAELQRAFVGGTVENEFLPTGHVPHINPFHLKFNIGPGPGFAIGKRRITTLPSGTDGEAMERIGEKLVILAMRLGGTHRFLNNSPAVPNGGMLVSFFGIRYAIRPGETHVGLGWHQDLASWQALTLLKRPDRLSGGNLVIGWPEEPPKRMTIGEIPRVLEWDPPLDVNRMLLFDGAGAIHKVTDFTLPAREDGGTDVEYRDVIGLTIE